MKFFCLISVVLATAFIAACGSSGGETEGGDVPTQVAETTVEALPPQKQDRSLWVAMDGWDTAESLAFPMAEELNDFTKVGVEVVTLSPVTPRLSIPDVKKRQDEVGVAHGPEAVLARAKGVPIVILGSFVPQPTAAMIWPKESKIDSIADLKGKTIAIPGLEFQRDFLKIALAQGGMTLDDVKVKKVGNDLVPALLHGRADAIFGGSMNLEGAELRDHGVEPVATPVSSFGIPSYEELVLVAREDWAAKNPDTVHSLVDALARGASAAIGDPKAATEVLESDGERNPAISPRARGAEVRQTLPLLSETVHVSAARTKDLIDWMYEEEMIPRKLPASELLASP